MLVINIEEKVGIQGGQCVFRIEIWFKNDVLNKDWSEKVVSTTFYFE